MNPPAMKGPTQRLLPFDQAMALMLEHAPAAGIERIRIESAAGRILREDLCADRDFPPFDRVMMDGYAIRAKDLVLARRFRVAGRAPAGEATALLPSGFGHCLEVMTGAPLPAGADCIVPVEETTLSGDQVIVADDFQPPASGFIHRSGSDAAAGDIVLTTGTLLGGREIGIAASCGAAWLPVSKLPRIAVLATGDELVAVDATPATHQIRQSNAHALTCSLTRTGFPPSTIATIGDAENDRAAAGGMLKSHDWWILTGAVSKGARDFVPGWLEELGCERLFHGVAQRPGKPIGCWLGPDGQMVVALPGNPVSALTGLHAIVLPSLWAASGRARREAVQVFPGAGIRPLSGMTCHLPVVLDADRVASAAPPGNSGDFIGLGRSDGFIIIPPGPGLPSSLSFIPWI